MSRIKSLLKIQKVQVILALVAISFAVLVSFFLPKESDPNIGLVNDPSIPTVGVTSPVGTLMLNHTVNFHNVHFTVLKAEEAEAHESAHLITRAVGVAETLEVDMVSGEVRTGDRFLLASDGLTRVVPDAELAAELKRGSPDEAADRLLELVLERGAPDNVSLIITRIG